MTIQLNFEDSGLVYARVSGVVTRLAFDEAKKQVVAHIKAHGKIQVLVCIEEDFVNLEPFAAWHDNDDDEFIQQHVNQLAIVGSPTWSEDALLFFLSGLLPFSIQYFKATEEEFARAWLIA